MLRKKVTIILLTLALFQFLFINREFSLADNGDFTRYFTFIEKPCGFQTNWPEPGTKERKARQSVQPLFYWEMGKEKDAWFSSAHIFWRFGHFINKKLFSANTFTIRNAGLFHYLIQALFLITLFTYIFNSKSKSNNGPVLATIPIVLLEIDSTYSAFYNSFYAESVMIVVLQCILIGIVWQVFFLRKYHITSDFYLGLPLLAIMMIVASLSKRQYVFFGLLFVPIAIFSAIHIKEAKHRVLKLCILASLVLMGVFSIFYSFSHSNANGQQISIYYTNRHALYYGVIMMSDKKESLIKALDLPEESLAGVGHHSWGYPEAIKDTMLNIQVPTTTVIKAFVLDPVAFFKLYFNNMNELGHVGKIPLGSIPYESYGHPPSITSVYTSVLSTFSGHKLFIGVCIIVLVLCLFPFGLDREHHNALRCALVFLFLFALIDTAFSTFDGIQEASKHLVAASFCISAIYSLFLAVLISNLSRIHVRITVKIQ